MRGVAAAIAVGLALLPLTQPRAADAPAEATRPADVPADALTEARALAEAQGGVEAVRLMFTTIRDQMVRLLASASNLPSDKVAQVLDEVVLPELRAHADEFLELRAGLYAAHYSVAELRELHAFYTTPLGRKLIALGPTIAQESFGAGSALGQRLVRDAFVKHADELRRRGLKL